MSNYQALVAAREAQRTACEDCGLGTGTCDPVLMDNRKHLFCEPCCEDRRKRWDWRVPPMIRRLSRGSHGISPNKEKAREEAHPEQPVEPSQYGISAMNYFLYQDLLK